MASPVGMAPRDSARSPSRPASAKRSLPISARVGVHVDDAGLGREAVQLARGAVVEARADADQQVGFLDGVVGGAVAVHAQHAEEVLVARGDRADTLQRGDDRDAAGLRVGAEGVARRRRWGCRRRRTARDAGRRGSARVRSPPARDRATGASAAASRRSAWSPAPRWSTSFGRSISTGPGRPSLAIVEGLGDGLAGCPRHAAR